MEHTQKMFLVPQHQLDALKQPQQYEQNRSIRQTAQNELDKAMTDVLNLPDTDVYEKAKKYAGILQRYLVMTKQNELEKNLLTLSIPNTSDLVAPIDDQDKKDLIAEEVLKHMPKRSRKNAEHILEAAARAKNVISWTDQGEIVIDNRPVRGSHLYDLIKSVTATHNVLDDSRPVGWNAFLKTMARLNIPLSAIPNTLVRRAITEYKVIDDTFDNESFMSRDASHKRKRLSLGRTHRSSTPLRTPRWEPDSRNTSWLNF